MKLTTIFHWIIPSLLIMVLISCGSKETATPIGEDFPTQPASTEEIQTEEPADTATEPPLATDEVVDQPTEAGSGPSCTVLQELNLRFGPSTAHRPPIRKLPANSVVTPLGFVPKGYLGGTWAYVQDVASQDKGWVSAAPEFILCNVDLTTLPAVAYDPPPPYFPKTAQTSPGPGQGFCAGDPSEYSCVLTFSDDYLFQVQVFKNGVELNENDGVEPISFTVTKDDNIVYDSVENNAAYCIFGGNGPCNNWIFENGALRWKSGGPPVESGEYKLGVNVTVNGESSHWESFFTLDVPQ
jgi:hypothetical protein